MILSHVSCPNKFSGVARTFGRSDLGLGEVHLNFVPSLLLFSYKSCHGMCKTNTSLLVCSPFVRRMLVRETVACKCSVLK